jgi:hypothetical protein
MTDAPEKPAKPKYNLLRTPPSQNEAYRIERALAECRAIARSRRRRERRAKEKKLATARIRAYLANDEHTYLSLLDPVLRGRGAKLPFAVRGQGAVGDGPPKKGERTYRGVDPFRDGWRARLYLRDKKKQLFLGFFLKVEDAERALEHACARLGLPPPRYCDPPVRKPRRAPPPGVRVYREPEQLSLAFDDASYVDSSEGEKR